MERQQIETAIQAANVALTGRRRREASGFASIELKAIDPKVGRWELIAAATVGLVTVTGIVVAWLY
jgi:hypothetical protein